MINFINGFKMNLEFSISPAILIVKCFKTIRLLRVHEINSLIKKIKEKC